MGPVWVAHYVIALANATGWGEGFILEELPLSKGLQYLHAAACINGAKTVPLAKTRESLVFDMKQNLKETFEEWQPN